MWRGATGGSVCGGVLLEVVCVEGCYWRWCVWRGATGGGVCGGVLLEVVCVEGCYWR